MLVDLVKKFQIAINKNPNIVLDNYKLKNGLYIRFDVTKTFEENVQNANQNIYVHKNQADEAVEKMDLYEWFKIRDFYSSMLNDDANKLIDLPGKKVHSTNPLTFFMKEELLIGEKKIYTPEQLAICIEEFYIKLQKSSTKFLDAYPIVAKSKKLKEKILTEREEFFYRYYPHLMMVSKDGERIQRNDNYKKFLLKNSPGIIELFHKLKEEYDFKNYIKIFFDANEDIYRNEYELYILPRIFTVDAYNYANSSSIVGLPSGDMTVNSKKPFLLLKTLKANVPLRIPVDQAIARKDFYSWLGTKGKFKEHVFQTDTIFTSNASRKAGAYHIRIDKNGGIDFFENVPFSASDKLNGNGIEFKNVINVTEKVDDILIVRADYEVDTRKDLQSLINKYFFRGRLLGTFLNTQPEIKGNDFTNNMLTCFLKSRQAFYDFFIKGTEEPLREIIDKLTLNLIEERLYGTFEGPHIKHMAEAFNLRLALLKYFRIKGGDEMADCIRNVSDILKNKVKSKDLVVCESDQEFYYLAGQLGYYLLSQSQVKSKTIGMFEPILRAKYEHQVKRLLKNLLITYGHAISIKNTSFKNAFGMVMGFETDGVSKGKNKDILLAGLLASNMFYEKYEEGVVKDE
ncbi:hypothetical protein AT268_28090 [Bacillus cereus]|uniref:CRISPR-associated protein Csh1 n=1 Tax=Bacillus cereus TaxID=1396 RepID=A0A9X0MGE9_BACCE|nr:hypothetical protein [Bacillus cereus]KXY39997.1 hypothetical protein AT268_28090 [Bacillus cereus]HDR5276727.1 hypothetical protein [Bacillus thuringiensis]